MRNRAVETLLVTVTAVVPTPWGMDLENGETTWAYIDTFFPDLSEEWDRYEPTPEGLQVWWVLREPVNPWQTSPRAAVTSNVQHDHPNVQIVSVKQEDVRWSA